MSITYRECFKAWWPDYDHSPEKCFASVQRGLRDMDIAIGLCKQRKVCVQAGGHAGFWPMRLAERFERVVTFECEPVLYQCLVKNTQLLKKIETYPLAIGAFVGKVAMRGSVSAGSWRIDPAGKFPVDQTTIDVFGLTACDAIFLDIEGYEVEALKGAAETIGKFRPVIHVEELPRSREAIRTHMKVLGYILHARVHSDCIYVG